MTVMTIHVLHAGDGYLYLIRSVAAHDGHLAPGESLSAYYTASGQPPGRWAGSGARRHSVSGVVTEAQMRALFGEGMHPDAAAIKARLVADGRGEATADRAVRLGRRFPQYGARGDLRSLARRAYEIAETQLGRALTDPEKLGARQRAAADRFERRVGRAPLDPAELAALGDQRASREAVAGYDLVFTPVKSVTSLWGIASAETRDQIFEAHNAAVADAINWLEENVALTRTGNSGQAQINTLGVTAALFHHWDSRAGDPDLHTHVAISNKVQGPDEKWRSLDGRTLFAAAVSMSERYNTRIEDELRQRLDVRFEERVSSSDGRRAVREIVGMPASVIENFSKRRQGIEQEYQGLLRQYQEDHGRDPALSIRHRLYQQATLTERPDKQRGRSLEQMVDSWQREAASLLNTSDVADVIQQMTLGREHAGPMPTPGEIADRALDCLMATRATWNVHHLRAEAHRQSRAFPTDAREELVEAVVAAAMNPRRSIRIETPRTLPEPAELRRTDGESVFVEHGSTLFTSAKILAAERRITEAAKLRTTERIDSSVVDDALARSACSDRPLNDEQTGLVRAFCQSGRAVQLGLAPAGSGKTTAMRVVADAWLTAGRPIVALAPSAVAADVLAEELGTEADTLAKFDHGEPPVQPGTMILIDEAGMAGTLMLARVVDRAIEAGAVIRLLGDDHQLAAIEAGGVLRHLDHEVGSVRLHQVVRFADPTEATATLQVRDGIADAVDFYLSHNRVTAGTDAKVPDVAYAVWLADVREGRDSLLLASSATTVADLNARARADLVISGQVAVDGLALRDGNVAAVGDQVCTRRNARRLAVNRGRDWVKNGDGWRVLAVHDDGALTVEHRRHHGRVTLPDEYVRAHVELDYARTIRRAQGMTVDHAHLVVDPQLNREDLYVGLSRARHGTQLYVATMTDPGPDHLPESAGATREVLTGIIGRSGTEPSASEAIRDAVAGIGDLRRMAVEYEYALGVHVGDRYHQVAEDTHPGITADPAWPSVAHRLHLAEGAGASAKDVLLRAEAMRSYADARSDTQVLVFRLDQILAAATRYSAIANPPAVPSWLGAAPPTALEPPWTEYLPCRYTEMADRITTLATEAVATRPTWLSVVGMAEGRGEAIRQVVAYRVVYEATGDDPVGPEPPARSRQHEAWAASTRAIRASQDPAHTDSSATRLHAVLARNDPRASDDAPQPTAAAPAASFRKGRDDG